MGVAYANNIYTCFVDLEKAFDRVKPTEGQVEIFSVQNIQIQPSKCTWLLQRVLLEQQQHSNHNLATKWVVFEGMCLRIFDGSLILAFEITLEIVPYTKNFETHMGLTNYIVINAKMYLYNK